MAALHRFWIAVAATTLLVAPCTAQETHADTCRLDGTQQAMNACAFARLEQADAQMNRLYAAQMSYLVGASRQRLRGSQRAWLAYRDKACRYETGPREESGSIWPLQDALCREALTRQRSEVLRGYVACRQEGCPG